MVRASYGITFETFSPVERSEHLRADVALFVGFVTPRRRDALSDREWEREAPLRRWLLERGFHAAVASLEQGRLSAATLPQVPLPVEAWGTFAELFAWDRRPIPGGIEATTYLGAAVRAFFAQGGRKAYVVRAGDAWSKRPPPPATLSEAELAALRDAAALERELRLWELVPDASSARPPGAASPAAAERSTWRGVAHLFGLPDVSFVLVPDLPDVVDAVATRGPVQEPPALVEEVFVTCSDEVEGASAADSRIARVPPPACDAAALERWARVVSAAVTFLRRHRPEAQLVAALPLLLQDTGGLVSDASPLIALYEGRLLRVRQSSLGATPTPLGALTSALLQLATPWLKTLGSSSSPGEVEPPDGTLAGVLARSALARGTFRSAAGLPVPFVYDFVPDYPRSALLAPIDARSSEQRAALSALQRLCVFGRAPSGIQLLSDVSTTADESYRSAGASRLVGALLRAARAVGEEIAFDPSNEATWARVRERFEAYLTELWERQALRGATPEEAFLVRCDRTTMTQADIDAGRLLVHVQVEIAVAIEAIQVVLALTEGGRASLLGAEVRS